MYQTRQVFGDSPYGVLMRSVLKCMAVKELSLCLFPSSISLSTVDINTCFLHY